MIFYNNLLAKWFLGKKKHYFMGMFLFDFSSGINFVFVAFVVVDDSSFRYL